MNANKEITYKNNTAPASSNKNFQYLINSIEKQKTYRAHNRKYFFNRSWQSRMIQTKQYDGCIH